MNTWRSRTVFLCLCLLALSVFWSSDRQQAGAATFTHKETGETFSGTIGRARIINKTLVVKDDGTRVYLDLSEYDIEYDAEGPQDNEKMGEAASEGQDIGGNGKIGSGIIYVVPIAEPIRGVATIAGRMTIDLGLEKSLARSIELARKRKAEVFLLQIDTPGGLAHTAEQMGSLIIKVRDMRTVAFVQGGPHKGAFSAGALLALSCDRIYMAPGTCIGAATPYIPGQATIPEVQEKFTSASSAIMRATAEQKGHSQDLGEAMVDAKVSLFLVVTLDDKRQVVKAEDEEEALDRAGADRKEAKLIEHITKEGTLLTMTFSEAEKYGLSAGTMRDLREVVVALGIDKPRVIKKGLPCWPCLGTGWVECPWCDGAGKIKIWAVCPKCDGAGGKHVTREKRNSFTRKITVETVFVRCEPCVGTGKLPSVLPCSLCYFGTLEQYSVDEAYVAEDIKRVQRQAEAASESGRKPGRVGCPSCKGEGKLW